MAYGLKLCGIGAIYVGYGAAGDAPYGIGIPWTWLGYGTDPDVACGGEDGAVGPP